MPSSNDIILEIIAGIIFLVLAVFLSELVDWIQIKKDKERRREARRTKRKRKANV
jgi:hypothetical protein